MVAREELPFAGKIFQSHGNRKKMKMEFGPAALCTNLGLTFGGVGVKRFWFWVILSSR